MIGRRTFIGGVGFGLIASPLMIRAQQLPKVHRIGCLLPFRGTADVEAAISGMIEGLRDRGWVEGRNLKIEYRSAENRPELYDELARELVALNCRPDRRGKRERRDRGEKRDRQHADRDGLWQRTRSSSGWLRALLDLAGTSQAWPCLRSIGESGWSSFGESVSGASRVAVIANPSNRVYADYVVQNEAAAKRLGLQLQMLPVARAEQLDEAFVAIKREKADALVVGPDSLYLARMQEISDRASTSRLPLIGPNRRSAELGALIGYGYDFRFAWRGAAAYIDRILKGAKPSDLPVEQPNKFELGVNLKTAKALGITIPQSVLLRADEVIQ